MDPINYDINVATPFQAGLQGFQGGLAISDALRQQKLVQQQQQQQQIMQNDLGLLAANPSPTATDYAAMMTKYPQLSDHFKKSWDVLSADQQQNKLQNATQVHAALTQGRPDVAVQLMQNQVDAYKNSGNDKEAQAADTMRKLIQLDPSTARTTSGLLLSSIMGPDKFASTFNTLGNETRAQDQAPSALEKSRAEAKSATYKAQGDAYLPQQQAAATQGAVYGAQIKGYEAANTPQKLALENSQTRAQIQNLDSTIAERAARLNLDTDKFKSDVQMQLYKLNPANNLDDQAKKLINDNVVASTASNQAAQQMIGLADKLETSGASSGLGAKGAELYKSLTGNQDAITQLRQEYTRLRSTQVSKMLPPGAASDKDIALAMAGFPSDQSDPKTMASFLRGMAKLQQVEAASKSAQAEWVNSVGHMGKPKQDIEINGIKVPAGTNYADFSSQFINKIADDKAAASAAQAAQGRSYMRFGSQPKQNDAGGDW